MHHRQLWPIWHRCSNNRLSAFDTTTPVCLADSLQARPMGWLVSINKHDSNMCATSTSTSSTPKLSQQHCENLYSTGLATAADIQQKLVKSSTLKARRAAVKEVAEWMHSMHDVTGWTMLTAIPEDILVYFTQHWLPNHARSSTAGTELIAAPSSLTGIKSHLATQTGSPMHNMQVKNMLKGYANHATELG